jgi:aspartyl-tRNA(Asn)/glutamyl-tRNA(Gln) amidotransferase subunit A
MTDSTQFSIVESLAQLRSKTVSAVELTQAYLQRIEALEPSIGAYITTTPERALRDAQAADEARAKGDERPLLGVPLAIKDVLSTTGIETTCGSKILKGYVPVYTATAVQRLEAAGSVTLGKANMDEFAMGSSTENSAYHVTRNPWDTARGSCGANGGRRVGNGHGRQRANTCGLLRHRRLKA